jgi:heat shock protein HslJ
MRILFVLFVLFTACSPKISPDKKWNGKKWVLVELKGVPVQTSDTDRDAHIIFDASKKSFFGTGGCNRINGAYHLTTKGKLTFINPASTKMACDDLAFETLFLETLKSVNAWSTDDTFFYLKKDKEVLMKLK